MSSLYFFRKRRVRYLVKGLPYRFLSHYCFIWLPCHRGGFEPIFSRSLPELLPPFFLPSELSSASVSLTDVLELCDDMDWAGLLLVFGLLECCDLLEFFFFLTSFLVRGLVVSAPQLYPCSSRLQFSRWTTHYFLVQQLWFLGLF